MNTTPASSRSETEEWLESLGTQFRNVWLYARRNGSYEWFDEQHVDDPETFEVTVEMSRARFGASYVVYEHGGKWILIGGKSEHPREYPSREAAEMVAIHGG